MGIVKGILTSAFGRGLAPNGGAMPALWLLLAAAATMFASCGSDKDGDTPDRRQTVRVVMNINVGAAQPATRANTNWTDPDPTSAGNAMENHIDASSLHIFLYNSAGEFVASASPITASRVSGSETQYQVVGSFEVSTLGLSSYQLADAKVAVFANSRSAGSFFDGLATAKRGLSDISDINADYDATTSAALQSIPMYGVKKATLDLTPGNRNELGDIYMLRSLAKVEVELSDSLTGRGYTLTSATLTGCNTLYNELPAGYASVDNTQLLTYDTSTPMSFNPCDGTFSAATTIGFTGKPLYLPELTVDATDRPVNISVELTRADGLTRTATFPFAAYSSAGIQTGTMNIVRNHHYRFVIIDSSLRVQLDVLPWVVFRHSDIVI